MPQRMGIEHPEYRREIIQFQQQCGCGQYLEDEHFACIRTFGAHPEIPYDPAEASHDAGQNVCPHVIRIVKSANGQIREMIDVEEEAGENNQ